MMTHTHRRMHNHNMNLSCTRSAAAAKLQTGVAFLLLGRHICRLTVLASADRQRSCQLLSLPAMVERERRRSEEPERGARERRCDGQVCVCVCVCVTNALRRTILSPQRHPPEPLPQDEVVAAASRLHQTCTQPPPSGPPVPSHPPKSTPALSVDLLTPYSRVAWPAVNRVLSLTTGARAVLCPSKCERRPSSRRPLYVVCQPCVLSA